MHGDGMHSACGMHAALHARTPAPQVASGRLKRHVLKNQDKLIEGVTNVTRVDEDVKVRPPAPAHLAA